MIVAPHIAFYRVPREQMPKERVGKSIPKENGGVHVGFNLPFYH
jgi:hypothetical protein